jgi:hypothetical protein
MRILCIIAVSACVICAVTSPAAARGVSAQRVPSQRSYVQYVNQMRTPAEPFVPYAYGHQQVPLMGIDPRTYMMRKAFAAHNPNAPVDFSDTGFVSRFNTPPANPTFKGMANSPSICPYFGGCQPPDMALAASTGWVVQAVNMSVAVYSPTGVLQPGFPKNAQTFFNVPNPQPAGCDSHGPFLSDPRAFYDRNDKRFWVAMLQVEGNFGVGNTCTKLSKIWLAVSQTNDPNAAWNVYNFNMDFSQSNFSLDYTQLGFDELAVYFGGNMYGLFTSGDPFKYDEIFFADKHAMESGSTTVTANGFFNMIAGGATLDTLQPVETQTTVLQRPGVEYLVGSENLNFGGGQCVNGCNGLNVYAIFDPLGSPSLTGVHITMRNYTMAPSADQPGCTQCIETLDTRISATPVYTASRNGVISFALETGVSNSTMVVPGVLWAEVQPVQSGGSITSASVLQSGIIKGPGDEANSFGATMASPDGSLWIVSDRMSATVKPAIAYRVQRLADALGHLENRLTLHSGNAATIDSRWGDFEATSLDDAGFVWLASQYSGSTGDWATFMGRDI